MIWARSVLVVFVALVACGDTAQKDNPIAPGVAQNEEEIDPMVVGHRLMDAGEHELAIDAYSRAALTHGMNAEVLAGIGSAHLALGRLHTAERLMRRAIDQDEDAPEYWNNLGVILMERGEIGEASQVFQRAYAFDNGESDAIRDNLRLALEKLEDSSYSGIHQEDFALVRRGSSDYLIRETQ